MKYAYEDLGDAQFEDLVVLLCQELFGIATQGFARGKDGGRDAKFVGTAEMFPSRADPWTGTTIIQAKHTNGYNRSFSEFDFFSPESDTSVIGEEIPRIRNLRKSKELDHYLLFSNRRLTGNAEADIRAHISKQCELPLSSVSLCGVEQLERWLQKFPGVVARADLDLVDSPLTVQSDDLAEIVEALARQSEVVGTTLDDPPAPRVTYEDKNQLNNMSAAYARAQRERYLKETRQIHTFLAAPENRAIQVLYESVADEFELKIIARRKDYQEFDQVMEYLVDLLFSRDAVLRQRRHKRLTRALLFYMYWNCDIGGVAQGDAETN